ncbi:MAG: sigma 54-interacting transcriptional regulator [Gammaproteobacteria bacterium]
MKFIGVPDGPPTSAPEADPAGLLADERWRVLGDMIPDGLILIDRGAVVRYMNSAAESITEVSRLMAVGRPVGDLAEHARIDCASLREAWEHGARINKLVQDAEGRSYVITTRGHPRQWGAEDGLLMVVIRSLDALARICSRGGSAPEWTFALAGTETRPLEIEPIVSGEAAAALVAKGLRAIAMGSRLLLLGESGVGKTVMARLLHRRSGPADRPFVHVNCGSIPDTLFESEMFGYERGSFTGASARGKKGLIEAADGGTLFLDEVGEIPLHCQAKMLRTLEDGLVQRVGATAPRRLRLQVISATNRDLHTLVEEGRFRRDLYYRLSVVMLQLPPLRECRELIRPLLDRFLEEVNQRRPAPLQIEPACRQHLLEYSYPGNVRELQNVVEHLAVVCDRVATRADLPSTLAESCGVPVRPPGTRAASDGPDFPAGFDLRETVRTYESSLVEAAIRKAGSKRKAAELLNVDIATVVRKSRPPLPEA